ncbi:MAG: DUF2877 domain-containing protein, partial [Stellaceae bacterium]
LAARGRRLRADIVAISPPKGFGALLQGKAPDFPLDLGGAHALAIFEAFRRGDQQAVHDASLPLLGFGPGLTPSGDDFIGAALFGRRLLALDRRSAAAWSDVARRLSAAAEDRSHRISAALFADLAEGQSFAALHCLANALAVAAPRTEMLAAACDLVAIGHSSGWDMLTGFIAGIASGDAGHP